MDGVFKEKSTTQSARGTTFLLTFIGPWSALVIPNAGVSASPPPLCEEVVRLRREARVVQLWSRALDHARHVQRMVGACDFAVCLEVCPETYQLAGKIQLHVHLCLRCAQTTALSARCAYMFDGAVICISHTVSGMAAKKSGGSWAPFFYRVVEKHSHVFHHSTRRPL